MARNFRELEAKMGPERVARVKARVNRVLAAMLMADIRKAAGLTQAELAAVLGVKQPSLSKLESSKDMQISTLRKVIEALEGRVEIVAHMPWGPVSISQFEDQAAVDDPESLLELQPEDEPVDIHH